VRKIVFFAHFVSRTASGAIDPRSLTIDSFL